MPSPAVPPTHSTFQHFQLRSFVRWWLIIVLYSRTYKVRGYPRPYRPQNYALVLPQARVIRGHGRGFVHFRP